MTSTKNDLSPKYGNLRIQRRFLKEHFLLFTDLTTLETKIFFAVFEKLKSWKPFRMTINDITTEEIKAFTKSTQSNKELNRTTKKLFEYITTYFCEYADERPPFSLVSTNKRNTYQIVIERSEVFYCQNGEPYISINLDAISKIEIKKKADTKTFPFFLFLKLYRENTPSGWKTSFSTKTAKTIFGLSKYDYLRLPTKERIEGCGDLGGHTAREFFIEIDTQTTKVGKVDYMYLMEKYNIQNETETDRIYCELLDKQHFERTLFERHTIIPALEELQQLGLMIIIPQQTLKRSKANSKAETITALFVKKHQKFAEDEKTIIMTNGSVIAKNITNFRKLDKSETYTIFAED